MKTTALVTAALLLALGLSGCTGQASVGECARPTDKTSDDVDMTEVSCDSADAVYRLAVRETKRTGTCPRGDYLDERTGRTTKSRVVYCYVLNVREGDCLQRGAWFEERVSCTTDSSRRVSKVAEGRFDRAVCGAADETKMYSKPALTICITK